MDESAGNERAAIRCAAVEDADVIGQLLYDFNREFDEPAPEPAKLADRIRQLLRAGDDTVVLLAGAQPYGLAVLRFRPAIWSSGLECYLAELYVVPDRRGEGTGRALMTEAIELAKRRGADTVDLGTSDSDVAARRLYESLGFINREGGPDGSITYFYELDLSHAERSR